MQLRRTWALAVAICLIPLPAHAGFLDEGEHTPGYLLRLFGDSDRVGVRSQVGSYSLALANEMALKLDWNNERVVIPAIDAPAGSQESVDAITTASRPISGDAHQDFVKVRNEFQGGVARGGAGLDYYVSSESDYLAQQVAARYGRDYSDQQTNVSMGTSFGWDAIDPLEDDDTIRARETKTTLHLNTVATQVLTPSTMVRVGLELNVVSGLQHNPYRNVYAGGTNVPERHPDHRQRRDAFVRIHQYMDNRSSAKLSYRFYNDDWGIQSHEIGAKLSQYVNRGVFANYEYRYYTQSEAYFHRGTYASPEGIDGYRSGDYRMGRLGSHLFGVAFDVDLDNLAPEATVLSRLGVTIHFERYFNSNNYSANIFETGLSYRF